MAEVGRGLRGELSVAGSSARERGARSIRAVAARQLGMLLPSVASSIDA
jgi:hypothetical protein